MRKNKKNPGSVDTTEAEATESVDAEEVENQVSEDADVIEAPASEVAGEADSPESEGADEAECPEPEDADEAEDLESEDTDESEDSESEDADETESMPRPAKKDKLSLVDHKYKITWLLSLPAGILGAVIGFILISLFTFYTGKVFFPLFVIAPLLAFLFNSLFKGGRDIRSLIVIAIFSLIFAYSAELAGRAALFARDSDMSAIKIPSLVMEAFGRIEAFTDSLSNNTYPLVFTALGIFLSWELLRVGRTVKIGSEIQDTESEESDTAPDDDVDQDDDVGQDNGVDLDDGADLDDYVDQDDDANPGNDLDSGDNTDPDD